MNCRLLLYPVILLLCIVSISCEEDFDPRGGLSDKYALYGIVSINSYELQTPYGSYIGQTLGVKAFITRTYEPVNILAPETSPALLAREGKIVLTQNYLSYEMRDYVLTVSPRLIPDNARSDNYELAKTEGMKPLPMDTVKVKVNYYTFPIRPRGFNLQTNVRINMAATMPDGKVLTSQTTIPVSADITLNFDFTRGITPKINQFLWGNGVTYKWDYLNPDHIVACSLKINYTKISTNKTMSIAVPMKYITKDGKSYAIYPSPGKYSFAHFEFAAFDSALKKLSEGDPDKKDYKIINCTFSFIEYDSELSTYFSSTHGSMDSYSVRLDENVYSNVRGGLGIFGSYNSKMKLMYFDYDYIKSFGYKYLEWR